MVNNDYSKQLMVDAIKPQLYDICDSQIDENDFHILDLRFIENLLVEPIFQMMVSLAGSIVANVVANMVTPYVIQFIKNVTFIQENEKLNITKDKAKLLMIAAIESYKNNQSSDLLKIVEDVYEKYFENKEH